MIKTFIYLIIGTAFAQSETLIPCEDGSMADPVVGCTETPKAIVNAQSDLLAIILKTANALVTIAAAVAVAVLIYGGITYALSIGNEDKIRNAKDILFWSIFGLIVTLLAKYIVIAVLLIITQ